MRSIFINFAMFFSGGKYLLRSSIPHPAFVQGIDTGVAYIADHWFHAVGTVGRNSHMRSRRDALVPAAGHAEWHSVAHTGLSISPASTEPRAGRSLLEALQDLQDQQEALSGVGQGGEGVQSRARANLRHRGRHTGGREAVDIASRQVSLSICDYHEWYI